VPNIFNDTRISNINISSINDKDYSITIQFKNDFKYLNNMNVIDNSKIMDYINSEYENSIFKYIINHRRTKLEKLINKICVNK